MSVDTVGRLGREGPQVAGRATTHGRELDAKRIAEKLGWLRDYRAPLRQWEQSLQVIETAETLVRREGHHAESEAELRERLPPVEADSLADRLRRKLLEFMKEQALRVSEIERLPGSSEVLESIIGKYKTLQGEKGQFGATSMLLSHRCLRRSSHGQRHRHGVTNDQRSDLGQVGTNQPRIDHPVPT